MSFHTVRNCPLNPLLLQIFPGIKQSLENFNYFARNAERKVKRIIPTMKSMQQGNYVEEELNAEYNKCEQISQDDGLSK